MTIQMTVIGLGQIGTSIGLALAQETNQLLRVGHDRSSEIARKAQKMGAFDRIETNLHAAVEQADLVVLALPADEIRQMLEWIGEDLKPETVVLDTSVVKAAVFEWAAELLPSQCPLVGFTPTLNPAYFHETETGYETAHSDLFKNSQVIITSSPGTPSDALTLASNLVVLLGAQPLFADAVEADGLATSSILLPQLSAAALLNAITDQPGWKEARKLAGSAFADATQPMLRLEESKAAEQIFMLNRANVVRVLDDLIASLQHLRQVIENQDDKALHQLLEQARQKRQNWWQDRQQANWATPGPTDEMPTRGEAFGRLFGLGRRSKEKK